jgi:thiol-disulfide isomerase/thioredoxin
MKIKKSAFIGIALLLLMISTTLYYFLFSIVSQPSLPAGNIVNYELSLEQKNLVLRQGKVLMEFFYGSDCQDCQEKKSLLEFIANQYKDKVFLEEISLNYSMPELGIIGFNVSENKVYLDTRGLAGANLTEENVRAILCNVTLYPPLECVNIK